MDFLSSQRFKSREHIFYTDLTNKPQTQGPHCVMCNEIVKKEENGKTLSIHLTNTIYKCKMHIEGLL